MHRRKDDEGAGCRGIRPLVAGPCRPRPPVPPATSEELNGIGLGAEASDAQSVDHLRADSGEGGQEPRDRPDADGRVFSLWGEDADGWLTMQATATLV